MKKKYHNLIICLITLFFFLEIFNYTDLVIKAIYEGSIIWFTNIVPTILPIFIITDILENYHITNYISKLLGKVMSLFKLPKETAYVFFMSIFSGFPGNSKFIKEMLDNHVINDMEATKLLTFTHFSNPLFIIGTIGIIFLENKLIGILILIVHYLTNVIVGLLFRNIYIVKETKYYKKERPTLSFINTLKKSILNTINTLFLIYGIIIFFFIITTIMNEIITLSPFHQAIMNGLIEMTQGLKLISQLNVNLIVKATMSTFLISFGGLSIHLQVMSILDNYKINYYIYFLARILHASLASIIIYIILSLTYY